MTSAARKSSDPDRDEDEITSAFRAGDRRRVVTLLMDRHGDDILRFACEMTRDEAVAEEVRQQTFVEAYRDVDRFEERSSWRTWLTGIARHRCLDAIKLRNRWLRRYKNDLAEIDAPEADVDLDRELDRGRIAQLLEDCLGRLAPAAREAVLLRYQLELSYDEVAEVTGERAGTLQQRVARALPVLRRCVESRIDGRAEGPIEGRVERAGSREDVRDR